MTAIAHQAIGNAPFTVHRLRSSLIFCASAVNGLPLLDASTGKLDGARPFHDLPFEVSRKFLRAAADWDRRLRREATGHIGRLDDFHELGVKTRHDNFRRA